MSAQHLDQSPLFVVTHLRGEMVFRVVGGHGLVLGGRLGGIAQYRGGSRHDGGCERSGVRVKTSLQRINVVGLVGRTTKKGERDQMVAALATWFPRASCCLDDPCRQVHPSHAIRRVIVLHTERVRRPDINHSSLPLGASPLPDSLYMNLLATET